MTQPGRRRILAATAVLAPVALLAAVALLVVVALLVAVTLPSATARAEEPADVVLVLTGSERGLLKPCGCSEPQRGGLARRAAFVERARPKARAFAALSVGDALAKWDPIQNGLKADLFRASLTVMGYSGMLLSPSDLWVSALVQPYPGEAETPRPPLNLKVAAAGPLGPLAVVDTTLRGKIGDLPFRAVSVIDTTAGPELKDLGFADFYLDPDKALGALLREPGLLVVAAHALREDMTGIARAAEGKADVVVVVDVPGGVADARPTYVPGKPFLVHFDEYGKEVGVLTLRKGEAGWSASWKTVPLDPEYEAGASALRDEIDKLFAAYRRRVRDDGILEKWGSFPDADGGYAGSNACAKCHEAIHDSWKATKHASALKTLEAKGYDWDPECVRCHTVGWDRLRNGETTRTKSSFQTPDKTPDLAGVGCEDCHGPGKAHAEDPAGTRWGTWGKTGDVRWKDMGQRGCQTCHDVENSVRFLEDHDARYRPKVDHREVPKDLRTVVK